MKKVGSILLAFALALSLGSPVFAEELLFAEPYEGELADESALVVGTEDFTYGGHGPAVTSIPPVALYGTIIEELEGGSILVQSDWNEEEQIVLHISDETFIVDAQTGVASSLAMRENDHVAVFYGPMTTMSLPPQSPAVAIAVNLPENAVSPHYAKVERIERNEDSVRILTGGGSLYITIGRDAPISPYLTRNFVTIDNLRVGSELMVWYDIVAMSYPGQTMANRTVILRNGPVGDVITVSAEDGTAVINSDDAAYPVRVVENGVTLLPLRQMCEAMGYTVNWLPEDGAVEIIRDEQNATLTFGSPVLTLDESFVSISCVPEVEDGVTYVPVDFFQTVLAVDTFVV